MRGPLGVWKRAGRHARAFLLGALGENRRALDALDGSCALVLMYHRVLPVSEANRLTVEPGMYVTPETFKNHLNWIQERLRLIPLSAIVESLETGRPLPVGACAITFDDGWRDNYEFAFPSLRSAKSPATIFVVPQRVGSVGAFWPDDVVRTFARMPIDAQRRLARGMGVQLRDSKDVWFQVLSSLKAMGASQRGKALAELRNSSGPSGPGERELLDWSEIDEMAAEGIDFESHGLTHAILTGLAPNALRAELAESREMLMARGHGRCGLFAYPSGSFNRAVVEAARAAGYRAAVTTQVGVVRTTSARMALPRLGLHEGVSWTRSLFLAAVPRSAIRVKH